MESLCDYSKSIFGIHGHIIAQARGHEKNSSNPQHPPVVFGDSIKPARSQKRDQVSGAVQKI